jgi:hypothetical protein
MSLIDQVSQQHSANRVADLERLSRNENVQGDFQGSVTGYWVQLDSSGAGVVRYNNKNYVTKPIGFTSLPAGHQVELSHANGVYYSKW